MSIKEKRTLVSIFTGLLVLTGYCIYAFGQTPAPEDLKFWARTILIFIGVGVGASIVIQIVFHILMSIGIAVKKKVLDQNCDDKEIEKTIGVEMVEDEMDKLIEMKSMRVGFFIAGFGFIAALVSVLLNYSAVVMLNILFLSFNVGSLIEGFTQLYYYKRGV